MSGEDHRAEVHEGDLQADGGEAQPAVREGPHHGVHVQLGHKSEEGRGGGIAEDSGQGRGDLLR